MYDQSYNIGSSIFNIGQGVLSPLYGITLTRSIKTMYRMEVTGYDFLGIRNVYRKIEDMRTQLVNLDFRVRVGKGMGDNGNPEDFEQVAWFNKSSIPEGHLHPETSLFLARYKSRIFQEF